MMLEVVAVVIMTLINISSDDAVCPNVTYFRYSEKYLFTIFTNHDRKRCS